MDQNHALPSASTQHRNAEEQPHIDSQDGNTHAPAPQNQTAGTTTTHTNPFVHPLMIPQLNPLYWPYVFNPHPMVNQFPFGPQVPFFLCPFPPTVWYYPQQFMMGVPVYVQSVAPNVTPPVAPQGPIAQSTSTGPGTSITVTFNEIGNDQSMNVQNRTNGRLSCCCPTNTIIDRSL
jgi:hypothetical protein